MQLIRGDTSATAATVGRQNDKRGSLDNVRDLLLLTLAMPSRQKNAWRRLLVANARCSQSQKRFAVRATVAQQPAPLVPAKHTSGNYTL
jgi:hypothetical protein